MSIALTVFLIFLAIFCFVVGFTSCKPAVTPGGGDNGGGSGGDNGGGTVTDPPKAGEYKPYFKVTFNGVKQTVAKAMASKALTINSDGIPTWTVQYQKETPYNTIQIDPVVEYFVGNFDSSIIPVGGGHGATNLSKAFAPEGVKGYDTAEHVNVLFWDIVAVGTMYDENGNIIPCKERLYKAFEEPGANPDMPFDMMTIRNPLVKLSNQNFISFEEIKFKFQGNLSGLAGTDENQVYATTYRATRVGETDVYINSNPDTKAKNPKEGIFYFPCVNIYDGTPSEANGVTGVMFPFNPRWRYPDISSETRHGEAGTPFVQVIYTTADFVYSADYEKTNDPQYKFDITKNTAMILALETVWDSSFANGSGGLVNVLVPTYYIHMDSPITFDSTKITSINVTWNPVLEKRYSIVHTGDPAITPEFGDFYTWPVNDPIPVRLDVSYEPLTDEVKADAVPADAGTGSTGVDPIQ